jgi:hypothetical protein
MNGDTHAGITEAFNPDNGARITGVNGGMRRCLAIKPELGAIYPTVCSLNLGHTGDHRSALVSRRESWPNTEQAAS